MTTHFRGKSQRCRIIKRAMHSVSSGTVQFTVTGIAARPEIVDPVPNAPTPSRPLTGQLYVSTLLHGLPFGALASEKRDPFLPYYLVAVPVIRGAVLGVAGTRRWTHATTDRPWHLRAGWSLRDGCRRLEGSRCLVLCSRVEWW